MAANNSIFYIFLIFEKKVMGAIIIKADKKSNRILTELARKLGGNVIDLDDEQFEDFVLGSEMDSVKTGKTVGREIIMKKLKGS
jgi:hypothetical protein